MSATTEAGNYATCQTESGEWYYHPTDPQWFVGNANTDFSRPYATEAEALEDAELKEQMDADGFDGVILDPSTGRARP